ncbi:MAG: stress responsive protein [Bacteroidales bacterium 36-12]|nr:MAG: stress responsive protein [Bacteroidales bacterium 36-12]
MIKHIVFFGIKDEAEGKSKAENMQIIKEELESLVNIIPQVKKLEVGFNHPEAPVDNVDLVIYSEFDSMDDLHTYMVHPEHKKAASYITKVRTSRACIDYEV